MKCSVLAELFSVQKGEPPEKKRKTTVSKFGPARDALLAFGLELTGALHDTRIRWNKVQQAYFPAMEWRELKTRLDSLNRAKTRTNTLVRLHDAREAYLEQRRSQTEQEKIDLLRRELHEVQWTKRTCRGCERAIVGTLFSCNECTAISYCSKVNRKRNETTKIPFFFSEEQVFFSNSA